MRRMKMLAAILIAWPAALAAQSPTPEGVYLVYGEPGGVGFITYSATQAEANQWPMSFFYYREGAPVGSATMLGQADCDAGSVTGALTGARGIDGLELTLPPPAERERFTFERTTGAGDQAIVSFICNDANGRIYLAEAPVTGALDEAAGRYIALRGADLDHRVARALAIRDADAAAALVDELVPEERRAEVRAILAGQHVPASAQ